MNFDPSRYQQLLQEKVTRLSQRLSPFAAPPLEVFESPSEHFRLRAEFRVWHQEGQGHYAMFAPGDKHRPILLDQFPLASRDINALMPALKAAWQANPVLSHKLFQVEFLSTLAGESLITLAYHRPLDETWQLAAQALAQTLQVSLVGRSRGKRLVIGQDYVTETLQVAGRQYRYQQPEGAFSQPNGVVCQQMLNWAHEVLGNRDDDLLELYCGNGNFTLPMASRVRRVLATEVSKRSIQAALANMADNDVSNVTLARLSAEELTQALQGVRPFRRLAGIDLGSYRFTTLFVDPPRAGLDAETCQLAKGFPRILYISCNPETLVNNLEVLGATHEIERCALFDQFPYSEHTETGVLLRQR